MKEKGEKKNNTEIDSGDWNALDRHWTEQYEKEFGHLF